MNLQFKTYMKQHIGQKGVVLFFALIALVVMSLAAVALIRSVDTSTIIAGNLASKQLATTSADSGLETAISWMGSVPDITTLNNNDAANGYYATQATDPTTLAWTAADSRAASNAAGTQTNGLDASGNTTRYVIQRMCRNTGVPTEGNCLFGPPPDNPSSQAVKDAPSAGANITLGQSPVYRVTARVVGVKNTVSFVQAYVY